MKTKILGTSDSELRLAGKILAEGGLVAFPTETVYGLGADAFNEEAVKNVYKAKGRPSDNPMIVHIARASDIGMVTRMLSEEIVTLIDNFWPGPLTIVVKKNGRVPKTTTGGLETVAVRMPDSKVARDIIAAAGVPIAAPSANISGKPSPTRSQHVIHDLDGIVDAIVCGEDCRVGIESTVLDMSTDTPTILRPGIITPEAIEAALDRKVEIDPHILKDFPDRAAKQAAANGSAGCAAGTGAQVTGGGSTGTDPESSGSTGTDPESSGSTGASNGACANGAGNAGADGTGTGTAGAAGTGNSAGPDSSEELIPKAPGMKYKHYAPDAEMLIVEGSHDNVRREIARLKALNEKLGNKVGVLLFEEKAFIEAAHDFFADLREMDEQGVDIILAGALSDQDSVGFAVMNRMLKSAGYNIVRV